MGALQNIFSKIFGSHSEKTHFTVNLIEFDKPDNKKRVYSIDETDVPQKSMVYFGSECFTTKIKERNNYIIGEVTFEINKKFLIGKINLTNKESIHFKDALKLIKYDAEFQTAGHGIVKIDEQGNKNIFDYKLIGIFLSLDI